MRLPWQETSITEDLLLELGSRFGNDIEIVPYTQNAEARTGADWRWEWLFEGEAAWFAMLVQAKKLRPIAANVYGYDFGYPAGQAGRPQVDVLIDYAADNGLAPVYALYNGPRLDIHGQWSCPLLTAERPLMGVGLLDAQIARHQLNFVTDHRRAPQQSVTRWAVPLPCLALCDSWYPCAVWPADPWTPPDLGFPDDTSPDDIAYRAAIAVNLLRLRPTIPQLRELISLPSGVGVHRDLPEAITARLNAGRQGADGDVDADGPAGAVIFHGSEGGRG